MMIRSEVDKLIAVLNKPIPDGDLVHAFGHCGIYVGNTLMGVDIIGNELLCLFGQYYSVSGGNDQRIDLCFTRQRF